MQAIGYIVAGTGRCCSACCTAHRVVGAAADAAVDLARAVAGHGWSPARRASSTTSWWRDDDLRRSDFRGAAQLPTRWSDDDTYGHVNNVVHYLMFDTAVNGWLIEASD